MRRPVCTAAQNDYVGTMDAVTSRPLPGRPLAIPNLLTYARIVAVPLVVACMYWQSILSGGMWLRWVALVIFVAAGITDILDGYFARSLGQQSSFGRNRDPLPRDPGFGPARISGRIAGQRPGHAARQVENHGAACRHRVPARRQGGRRDHCRCHG